MRSPMAFQGQEALSIFSTSQTLSLFRNPDQPLRSITSPSFRAIILIHGVGLELVPHSSIDCYCDLRIEQYFHDGSRN